MHGAALSQKTIPKYIRKKGKALACSHNVLKTSRENSMTRTNVSYHERQKARPDTFFLTIFLQYMFLCGRQKPTPCLSERVKPSQIALTCLRLINSKQVAGIGFFKRVFNFFVYSVGDDNIGLLLECIQVFFRQ